MSEDTVESCPDCEALARTTRSMFCKVLIASLLYAWYSRRVTTLPNGLSEEMTCLAEAKLLLTFE